ncbi:hypothetical protein GGI25_000628 [Coemansia spiralis]|uniref:Uncharacterized protein n=2 Tax=Coemansia TaxID=4863 RepID=A0A9W8G7D9_9FUNG|nr:hypothetical protein EDC05_000452 [Coemansia umbellata]KAJ2625526.1 hypothetical protein GGI26_000667 [Coemansia sp. RSA 1358]KAJ2680654.1 hypothetical protein GGI25_000628 [Coemansia spiralis]
MRLSILPTTIAAASLAGQAVAAAAPHGNNDYNVGGGYFNWGNPYAQHSAYSLQPYFTRPAYTVSVPAGIPSPPVYTTAPLPPPAYTTAAPSPAYTTAAPPPAYTTAAPPPPPPVYTTAGPPPAYATSLPASIPPPPAYATSAAGDTSSTIPQPPFHTTAPPLPTPPEYTTTKQPAYPTKPATYSAERNHHHSGKHSTSKKQHGYTSACEIQYVTVTQHAPYYNIN